MPVNFDTLKIGSTYDRPQLAKLWGYESFHAIGRGAVTPAGSPYVILFITKEKQEGFTQYQDSLEDGVLSIEGETRHAADSRIVNAASVDDEIHLFFRPKHHMDFTYEGRVFLATSELNTDSPSRFVFNVDPYVASALGGIETEKTAHGSVDDDYEPEEEGKKKIVTHVRYERRPKNRARALELHGNKCAVCGFDFNVVYGPELACDYIEVHHVSSITEQKSWPVDPAADLVPLCSNCHSMAHRRRGSILSVEELKEFIRRAAMA